MPTFAQRTSRATTALPLHVLVVVTLATVGLAACGDNSDALTPSAGGTAGPAASGAPVNPSQTSRAQSSTPTSTAVNAFEACALFSGAELANVLGMEVLQPRPMPSGGWVAGQCAWNGPNSGFFISVGTAASIEGADDAAVPDAKAKLAEFKAQAGGTSPPQDIPAIGDGAVLTSTGLAAYRGSTYLQITNVGLTEDQLIEIAKLAVARL